MTGSSLKEVTRQVAEAPSCPQKLESKKPESPGTNKPESIAVATPKPKSRACVFFAILFGSFLIGHSKSIAADEDFDDNASIADSTFSVTKTRRNEVERIEYYKNQPDCGILEPHAAQCTRCDKVVKLGRKQTYAVRPWVLHRIRCDQKPPQATQ